VDVSPGPSRDRLYFACTQASPSEVVVSTSGNRGESWTAARAISGGAADTAVTRKIMATAVSSRGVFGVAWTESGRNPAGSCADDVYFTASVDGGQTFLPAEKVAGDASCAAAAANGEAFSGDYFGLATDAQGRFRLLWSGVRERLLQLHLATIEVAGTPPPAR